MGIEGMLAIFRQQLNKLSPQLYLLLALLWALVIFGLSHQPASTIDLGIPHLDKLVHALVYGILAALLYLGTKRPQLSFLLSLAYGFSDEIHQSFIVGRDSDPFDLIADGVGSALIIFSLNPKIYPQSLVKTSIWLLTFAWALFIFTLSTQPM